MKTLTQKEEYALWTKMRKEDPIFEDLCDARDEVVRTIGYHDVVKRALISELGKWDDKIEDRFDKAIKKEIALKIKKK